MDEKQIPQVRVGIMNEPAIDFVLNGDYRVNGAACCGDQTARCVDGQVEWGGNRYNELLFEPVDAENASFTLKAVTIGVSFHWKRQEDQTFKGALHLIVEDGKLTPVNVLSVEDYLLSVISSEMSANASLELLKAHAVISRSWLLAQIHTEETVKTVERNPHGEGEMMDTPEELVKWWDREDHVNFDVCADDHCQRYQGITRASTEKVEQAIRATWGQVLMHGGALCDARFSKSCGGVMEEFENCWEPQHHDYLEARRDGENEEDFPDLTREDNAAEWILSSPSAFCNTTDPEILSQVLNDYDQETKDFYRWKVEYTRDEISELVRKRSGIDFGTILELIPLEKGPSGRIWKMKIVGSLRTMVIGKELIIRRWLSDSHLKSSAFTITWTGEDRLILEGYGWGHGVGLCQIGAAVMAYSGYTYSEILQHYYPGSELVRADRQQQYL